MFDKFIKLIKSRHFYLMLVVFFIAAAILLKLFNLQITNGQVLNYYATRGSYSVRTIEAPRGKIYDRNGKLIAYNKTGYNVQIVENNDIKNNTERDAMYYNLLKVFEKNGDNIENILKRYLTEDIEFGILLEENDDDEEKDRAERAELKKRWLQRIVNDLNQLGKKEDELDKLETARQIFDYFRDEVFKIDKSYTDKDVYNIMAIRYTILMNSGALSFTTPHKLATNISQDTMIEIETRHLDFPGVYTEEVYFRQYNDPQPVAHLLGHVRAMSEDDWDKTYKKYKIDENGNVYEDEEDKDGNTKRVYTKNDIIGKEGIEKAAETILKGKNGSKTIYIDKNGRELGEIYREDPVAGEDVYLTIDLDLQKVALESLIRNVEEVKSKKDESKNNFGDCVGGAVVVMDVKTGEVLASVSYPDFDPSIFLAPSSDELAQKAIAALYKDEEKKSASLNRATQGLYAPGSVFKPIVALAALQENKITKNTEFICNGVWEYGIKLKCLGTHRHISMIEAMTRSCNVYFCDAGVATGIESIDKYAKDFGLGEKTGIEISELQGRRSNEETMKQIEIDLTHNTFTKADTAQTSIGQLYTQFTPMQLARYTAAMGTKGTLVEPHLIQKTVSIDGTVKNKTPVTSKINGISNETYDIVKDGMIGVISDPSASIKNLFSGFGFDIAGKTGTPETGEEKLGKSSNGVFVCYAPADDPKIAISVVLERGVWGSYAAPIASDVLKEYFGLNEGEDVEYKLDKGMASLVP